jgi:hypothetical protein
VVFGWQLGVICSLLGHGIFNYPQEWLSKASMGVCVVISMFFTYYSATVKIVLNDAWETNVKQNCFASDWAKI